MRRKGRVQRGAGPEDSMLIGLLCLQGHHFAVAGGVDPAQAHY